MVAMPNSALGNTFTNTSPFGLTVLDGLQSACALPRRLKKAAPLFRAGRGAVARSEIYGTNRSNCGSSERRVVTAMPFRAKAWSFCATPLPYLAFKGREGALGDLAERHPVHEFAGLVALALGFDDLVKAVMRSLRDPRVEKNGTTGFRREPFVWVVAVACPCTNHRCAAPETRSSSDTCSSVSGGNGGFAVSVVFGAKLP